MITEMNPILLAFLGTMFIFLMTSLGAAVIFLFKKEINAKIQNSFLGFAAGVMLAAAIWSLIIPALEMAEEQGQIQWLVAGLGIAVGGLFLYGLDRLLSHLYGKKEENMESCSSTKRTTLLISAITLHNIPEGLAVGLTFALAAQAGNTVSLAAAIALMIGIGIQDFPEGAAISLPLYKEGHSKKNAFGFGVLSGAVEPLAGVSAAILVKSIGVVMPWLLTFSAGAMIYVVLQELIPEAQSKEHPHVGSIGLMVGFFLMMILDVALG